MHSGASFCPFVEITCSFVTGFSAPMEGFFPYLTLKAACQITSCMLNYSKLTPVEIFLKTISKDSFLKLKSSFFGLYRYATDKRWIFL